MIYCKNCGTKLPDGAKFCVNCGAKMKQDQPVTVSKPIPPNEKVAKKKKPIYQRWWFWVIVVFLGIGFFPSEKDAESETKIQDAETISEEAVSASLTFFDSFTEYGYTVDQIAEMKTILLNVGITEITELDIQPVVGGIQVIRGKVHNENKKDIDVQVNIENGAIYLVMIQCTNIWTALENAYDETVDLYYEEYIKKIDWDNNTVVDCVIDTGDGTVGSSRSNPIVITVAELANEINIDATAAKEKYNGKWVRITGEITDTSDSGTSYGYYLYGKSTLTGYSGLRIMCWCDDGPYSGSVIGDTQTFTGKVLEISTVNITEIVACKRAE